MNKDNSGPAFPTHHFESAKWTEQGMTLRDYFAAKAMQAALTSDAAMQVFGAGDAMDSGKRAAEWAAESAYYVADCMLKAREQ